MDLLVAILRPGQGGTTAYQRRPEIVGADLPNYSER